MNDSERQGSEADLQAIALVREAHVNALNAGDANAWTAQFTEDGVQMPPNAAANTGRAKIKSWSQGLLGQFQVRFALAVEEIRVLGEWALERGAYSISLNAKAGGPAMKDVGKYITVYQRMPADGWRMARDIWNSDNPPPRM